MSRNRGGYPTRGPAHFPTPTPSRFLLLIIPGIPAQGIPPIPATSIPRVPMRDLKQIPAKAIPFPGPWDDARRWRKAVRGLTRLARLHPAVRAVSVLSDLWDLWEKYSQWSADEYDRTGNWQLKRSCELNPADTLHGFDCLFTTFKPSTCFRGQFIGGLGNTCPAPDSALPEYLELYWTHPFLNVHALQRWWSRINPGPSTIAAPQLGDMQWLEYDRDLWPVPPWVDPLVKRVRQPEPPPIPPPWILIPQRATNPERAPSEQTERGYTPRRRPGTERSPAVSAAPGLRLRPYERAAQVTEVDVGPQGARIRQAAGSHQLRRARKGEKEAKRKAGKALRLAFRAVGLITEGMDLVNAMWKAVPWKKRPRGFHGPLEKAQWLYDNLDLVEIDEFALNVLTDIVEDTAIGKFSKSRQEVYREIGRPAGGPDSLSWMIRRLMKDTPPQ